MHGRPARAIASEFLIVQPKFVREACGLLDSLHFCVLCLSRAQRESLHFCVLSVLCRAARCARACCHWLVTLKLPLWILLAELLRAALALCLSDFLLGPVDPRERLERLFDFAYRPARLSHACFSDFRVFVSACMLKLTGYRLVVVQGCTLQCATC